MFLKLSPYRIQLFPKTNKHIASRFAGRALRSFRFFPVNHLLTFGSSGANSINSTMQLIEIHH